MTGRPPCDPGVLGDRLAALGTAALPPLPGAGAARARGAQRTRRVRSALGGSVALLAATAAATTLGGGAPATDADGSLTGPPSPAPVVEGVVRAALLDPQDLLRLAGDGTWAARPAGDVPFPVVPQDCGGTPFSISAPRNGDTGTASRHLGRGDGLVLGHQVLSFADASTAVTAFGRLVDAVESCPAGPTSTRLTRGSRTTSPTRLFGVQGGGDRPSPFVVERIGPVLSVVRLQPAPDDVVPVVLADAAAAEVLRSGAVPTSTASPGPRAS